MARSPFAAADGRDSLIRQYAGVLGATIIVAGVLGLILGERSLLGLLNIDILEDIIHLATGGLLAYVSFGRRDTTLARYVLLGPGVVYLLVGIVGFIVPDLFGMLPHEYSVFDNLFHIALGIVNIVVAQFVTRSGATRI